MSRMKNNFGANEFDSFCLNSRLFHSYFEGFGLDDSYSNLYT